jgi:hypothetical protein
MQTARSSTASRRCEPGLSSQHRRTYDIGAGSRSNTILSFRTSATLALCRLHRWKHRQDPPHRTVSVDADPHAEANAQPPGPLPDVPQPRPPRLVGTSLNSCTNYALRRMQDHFRRLRDVYMGLIAMFYSLVRGRRAVSKMEHAGGLVRALAAGSWVRELAELFPKTLPWSWSVVCVTTFPHNAHVPSCNSSNKPVLLELPTQLRSRASSAAPCVDHDGAMCRRSR